MMAVHRAEFVRRVKVLGYILALLLCVVAAWHWTEHPMVLQAQIAELEQQDLIDASNWSGVSEGKRDKAEKAREKFELLKIKRERQEYIQEHPGPLRVLLNSAFGFTFGPVLQLMGLLKMAPYIIYGGLLLVAVLVVVKIYRTLKPAKRLAAA